MILARYADAQCNNIVVSRGGHAFLVPAVSTNAVYRKLISEGITISPFSVEDGELPKLKAHFKARVDADAECARLRYITSGAGMAMTYQEKFAQAQAVDEMGAAAANAMSHEDCEAQFPTLAASIGLEADTIFDCAQLVLARYAAFARASLMIERARLSGKAAIAAAGNQEAVAAAYEAVTWPTP